MYTTPLPRGLVTDQFEFYKLKSTNAIDRNLNFFLHYSRKENMGSQSTVQQSNQNDLYCNKSDKALKL